MKLIVDSAQRFSKMRSHTATHLLHAELTKIFPSTKQAWSLVDDDLLRFDFYADRLLTVEELQTIEENINILIYQSLSVICEEMSMKEAQELWAKAFFDEKYWEVVRVVQVLASNLLDENNKKDFVSIELCGGTHVQNTKDVWAFVIVNQEAVASGIKRITAFTGPKVMKRLRETRDILYQVAEKLWVKAENQILDKLEKELKEKEEMNSKFESINTKLIVDTLRSGEFPSDKGFDKIINVSQNDVLKDLEFKNIIFQAKWVFEGSIILILNNEWWFALINSKENSSAKDIAQNLWLKWGWNENIVQWKDPKVLELFKY
jgi:alanyl-tRNA synthetase